MKIAIGSDHAGYLHKEAIKKFLAEKDIAFSDFGTFKMESVDYPDFAYKVSNSIAKNENDMGILVCGTGIGMSMTANKIKGIRAAVVSNEYTAQYSRLHNDANVLCLGARVISEEEALKLTEIWLNTSFEGGRHENRVNLISKLTGL